ncbi:glycosyltransferase family 4 protein [Phreatobacter sp. AB_2022a]|uniref:glycosyltransferase family 4 protein n=1 Tax=Phreatobacter sp. AB_2022a TaxID=3003134 RepID=UPI002287443B|nr:glycosyltransferase family 1 protein [Phreatobacter sp. AB_2022a]MCZ0733720.1 glycosyltransferase family 1 protein [Phreatobacter sp. AB_2022a]
MAPLPILIDGSHLKNISGIGSYTRTLVHLLQTTGQPVDVLFGEYCRMQRSDTGAVLAAQVFGTEPPQWFWMKALRRLSFLTAMTVMGRVSAIDVPTDHIDLNAMERPLPPFSGVINADAVFQRAAQRFSARQRFLEVDTPRSYVAAHWTSPLPIKARGIPNIYTLHDAIPLEFPYLVLDRGGRNARLFSRIAAEADLIVTVSEASKERLVKILGIAEERIAVTYQATPALPILTQDHAERIVRDVYGAEPGKYALFVGTVEPKKNLKRLMEAYLLAGVDIPLLLAGPLGWMYDDELAMIDMIARNAPIAVPQGRTDLAGSITTGIVGAGLGRASSCLPIQRLGDLPRRHVAALLQCARFFLFPSICEGFGLPVLEAMKLGVPVLTSSTSSLPEVVGEAALKVDPLDITALADGIRMLASDAALRCELAQRGHPQAAKFTNKAYRERLAAAYARVGVHLPEAAREISPQETRAYDAS